MYQDQHWPDCFAMLGFMASITSSVRLGTSVFIVPYRHPAVTAKMVATLDKLSNGRIIAGRWQRLDRGGVQFSERPVCRAGDA